MSKKEDLLKIYFKELYKIHNTGKATEPSFYPALKKLLESCFEGGLANVEEKKYGANKPDFVIRKGKELIGYIEAKDFQKFENLDYFDGSNDEQIKRYKDDFPNFILTNFFDFWLYRNGERIAKVKIGFPRELKMGGSPKDEDKFFEFLELFLKYSIPEKRTAKSLAIELAKRAKWIPGNIIEELNNSIETEIHRIYKAFREYLISDLSKEDFADIYAQTITYGLFTARLRYEKKDFNRFLAQRLIPKNIQIIHDTFNLISSMALPESLAWIVDDIATVLAYSDIKEIKEELHKKTGDDPLMHFYETFLAEYAPERRKARGVYYTPLPVVSYITRSINILLKEKFNKKQGFANNDVTLLDPASGTLTFPANAIRITKEEVDKSSNAGSWLQVVNDHILKNYYAFELLMAPYIIGHLKISLLLEDLGYKLKNSDRFKLYLTNTLDFKKYKQLDDPYISGLSKEAVEASAVKEREKILVIMGNPPYSVSSHNVIQGNADYEKVYNSYKEKVRKEEKNIQPLSDDYIKFIAFAHWKIQQNGQGIVGMITNNSYLDGLIHRDMRRRLAEEFDEIYILNLHGNSKRNEKTPEGGKDENVFDIQQGISIILLIKKEGLEKQIKYCDVYGLREDKYELLKEHNIKNTEWRELGLREPHYWFVPKDTRGGKEYQKFISLKDIFNKYNAGIATGKDDVLVDFDKDILIRKLSITDKDLFKTIMENYKVSEDLIEKWYQELKDKEINNQIKIYNYRPFDSRFIIYNSKILQRARKDIMDNFLNSNLGLCTIKQFKLSNQKYFGFALPTENLTCRDLVTNHTYIFPLFAYQNNNENNLFEKTGTRQTNFSSEFWKKVKESFIETLDPWTIFNYIYAILYSNIYREKYNEFLRIDFPKIPFTKDVRLFYKVAELGKKLVDLHLLKSEKIDRNLAKFPISTRNILTDGRIEKRKYNLKEKRIYINGKQYFEEIEPEIWNYYIGGYQVLDKWLKDRTGKVLSSEDVDHFLRVISALNHTIDLQKEIDKIYSEVEKNLIG